MIQPSILAQFTNALSFSKVLIQNKFRSFITVHYDDTSVTDNEELEKVTETAQICATRCAHILPDLTNVNVFGSTAALFSLFFSPGRSILMACGQSWTTEEAANWTRVANQLNQFVSHGSH